MNLSGSLLAGIFAFCTALFWGTYGPLLSRGHHLMGTEGRFRPFICVGVAYLLVAIVGPIVVMYATGIDKGDGLFAGWTVRGILWSTIAGAVGALGAFTLIMALGYGGPSSPIYVMPIVFGCAPVVSAFTSMYLNNTFDKISPFFAAGLLLVAVGAVTILITAPAPPKKGSKEHGAMPAAAQSVSQNKEEDRAITEKKPEEPKPAEQLAADKQPSESPGDWEQA